jgi:hypothetical protein
MSIFSVLKSTRRIQLFKADVWIQHQGRIQNPWLKIIYCSIPTILLQAFPTLLCSPRSESVQTTINNSTAKTSRPFCIKCSIALNKLVETIDKDFIKLQSGDVSCQSSLVRVCGIRNVRHMQNNWRSGRLCCR